MSKLKDIGQPSELWDYFEQITKIPRCSGQEEKVRVYVKEEAEKLGFKAQVDNAGNLVVKIPAKQKVEKRVDTKQTFRYSCPHDEKTTPQTRRREH